MQRIYYSRFCVFLVLDCLLAGFRCAPGAAGNAGAFATHKIGLTRSRSIGQNIAWIFRRLAERFSRTLTKPPCMKKYLLISHFFCPCYARHCSRPVSCLPLGPHDRHSRPGHARRRQPGLCRQRQRYVVGPTSRMMAAFTSTGLSGRKQPGWWISACPGAEIATRRRSFASQSITLGMS